MSNRRQIEEEPLNLVPIMNLVTILIPFLLLAMKSFELSVIDTTAPPISKDAKDKSDELDEKDKPLALSVAITYKGLRILGADEQLGIKKVDDAEADPNAAKEAGYTTDLADVTDLAKSGRCARCVRSGSCARYVTSARSGKIWQ